VSVVTFEVLTFHMRFGVFVHWIWRLLTCGSWCFVVWYIVTDVSEPPVGSIFRAPFSSEILIPIYHAKSWNSTVGIATGYGLDNQGVGVRVLLGARILLLPVIQTGCGAHSASYPVYWGLFPLGVKRPVHEANHSPPTCAKVKKTWV
jgi:hypothetical protein